MSKFKYYYRVNTQGEPIPGSNFRSTKRPMGVYFRELIPQVAYCCDPSLVKPTSAGDTKKFFVRINEDKLPISGSLRRVKNRLSWDNFQEVFKDNCCPIIGISIIPATATIAPTETQTYIVLGLYQSGKTLDVTTSTTFVSGTPATATIVDNIATGVADGSTVITGTYGVVTGTATLTVLTPVVNVTSVDMTPATASIITSATQQLTATVSPVDATDQTVSYVSDTPSVATVSASGLVTGISAGTAIITVTTTDGSFTDTSTITVTA